jgi:3-oxoacyl-[acyl-carrier protein] reductase
LLNGKVAIITGASKGIGFEMAREFAARGATVIACSRSKESAERTARLIKGKTCPELLDVTDATGVEKFVGRVTKKHGRIDILVNNAGYRFERKTWTKRFHEVSEEEFDRVMQVDLKGTLRLCRSALPVMIKNKGGVIINIASTPAVSGHTEGAPYTVAKAGVVAVTKHIALEYGDKGIRAYTLALGNISTDATFGAMTVTERKKAAMENSMKRWGDPREVARIAASITSDDFSFATGNTIVIDGGTVML